MSKPKKERENEKKKKGKRRRRRKKTTTTTKKTKNATSVWKKKSVCQEKDAVRFSDNIDLIEYITALIAGGYVRAVFRQHPLNRICHRLNCSFSDNLDLIEYVTALIVSGYVYAVFTQQRLNRMCHRFVRIVFFPPCS